MNNILLTSITAYAAALCASSSMTKARGAIIEFVLASQAPGCEFSRLSRRSEGGIAPVSGTGDRGFESRRFDHKDKVICLR